MAQASLNFAAGQQAMPALASRYLALYTVAPSDSGGVTGTEVTGTGYARVQVAGAATAAGTISTASATITMPNVSGFPWVTANMNVWDATNSKQIGTVLTWVGTTLTLTANAANNGSGSTDSLIFSAFPASTASSGAEPATAPATVSNASTITFAQAGAGGWGTVIAFAIFDALTTGNMLAWDYLGNFKWIPFSCSNATPGVLTTDATADVPANSSSVVVTQKYGGTLPTTGGSWSGLLTTAGASTNTFNVGVNTTSVGGGQFRQVTQQSIPANVTASFAANALTLTSA